MTIRVTDSEAEKRYEAELAEYREKVDKKIAQPSAPPGWPEYPKMPAPMFDSDTERSGKDLNSSYAEGSPYGSGAYRSPPLSECKLDFDGTADETPKGYESNWRNGESNPLPFTLKPK